MSTEPGLTPAWRRWLWGWAAAGLAGLGASVFLWGLEGTAAVVVLGGVMGAGMGVVVLTDGPRTRSPASRLPLHDLVSSTACGSTTFCLFAVATLVWAPVGIVALTVAAALTMPPVRAVLPHRRGTTRGPSLVLPCAHLDDLGDDVLRGAWRDSLAALTAAQTCEAAVHLVGLRESYLDELCVRDPDGLPRWLADDICAVDTRLEFPEVREDDRSAW